MKAFELQKGMWLQRRNGLFLFQGKLQPCMLVTKVKRPTKGRARIVVNGAIFEPQQEILVVSEEKGKEINQLFENLQLSIPESLSEEETCFTTYTGERTEKIKYSNEKAALKALFHFRIKYPEKDMQAYKCPNCQYFHLGKVKKEEIQNI